MIYQWYEYEQIFDSLNLNKCEISLEVINEEECEFLFEGKPVKGSKGKTCWYIPLNGHSQFCSNSKKRGLKIVKYPVYNDILDEYRRLQKEYAIQKILYMNDMAADIDSFFLVKNTKEIQVSWLNTIIIYPPNSLFFATIVEHICSDNKESATVKKNSDGALYGTLINEFVSRCKKLRIKPYDINDDNIFMSEGKLKVVDVHKWHRTYEIIPPSGPKYIQIELNNICNAKCEMCNIPEMTREKGLMTDNLFVDIIKQANDLGVEYITPFLHGEPFIRKDFVDKLKLINTYAPKAKITIFTNASLLSRDLLKELSTINNIEQIVFSFPGGNKLVYEKVTGLKFEQTMNNIKMAFEVLKGLNMRISLPKFEENEESEKDFYELWKGYPCSSYNTYNYLGDKNNTLSEVCYEQCDRAFRTMTILWNGKVCLCCMDSDGKYIMGDVSRNTLDEVWNNREYQELRLLHGISRNLYEPCRICTLDLKTEEYTNAIDA